MRSPNNFIPFLGLAASLSHAKTTHVSIPTDLKTHALVKDVYGYSIEPVWLDDYLSTNLASTLLSTIANVTGKAAPIRVGGNTADQTFLHGNLSKPSLPIPNSINATQFNITPSWFDTWANYFPEGTDLIYTLNFNDNRSAWANAVAEAEAAHQGLGSKLKLLELGNEIDHFANKGWRAPGWGVEEYIPQWKNASSQIVDSEWYKSASSPPKFQAAVFADPPWVPDQHDELDDMDIINVTKAGLVDPEIIDTYSVHMYPQSTCDTERWYRMSLDLLSNHTTVWLNVSQYGPQVEAANAAGAQLVNGETNSVSCSGRSGISDTLGAALWGIDYVFTHISIGVQKVYFHLGAQSQYSSFTPLPYEIKGENVTSGIRAGWYAHYFIANAVAGSDNYSIAALPEANSSDFSGFGIYGSGNDLKKLVFLDMGIWNGTEGLSNPSTLSSTDSTSRSNGTRPVKHVQVQVPWSSGSKVYGAKLSGPGTNAKSQISFGGVTFDPKTGEKSGDLKWESLSVSSDGEVSFELPQAGAILLEVASDSGNTPVVPPNTAASSMIPAKWCLAMLGLTYLLI